MALKATIYKANLSVADMDRGYYGSHNLTIACHPSETEFRLMVRILAFAMFAGENLLYTKGISTEDEPDIWEKDLTGQVLHWIELGVPDESRIRKGCNRSARMTVVAYGDRSASVWWDKQKSKCQRFANLEVFYLPDEPVKALADLITRTMDIQVSIQDQNLLVSMNGQAYEVAPQQWK